MIIDQFVYHSSKLNLIKLDKGNLIYRYISPYFSSTTTMTLEFNDLFQFESPSRLKKKNFLIIDEKAYQIVKVSPPIKGGKHGSAKYIFDVLELATKKKKIVYYGASDKIPIPELEKKDFTLIELDDEVMSLTDDDNRLYEGIPVPDNAIGESIRKNFDPDQLVIVTVKGYKESYEVIGMKIDTSV